MAGVEILRSVKSGSGGWGKLASIGFQDELHVSMTARDKSWVSPRYATSASRKTKLHLGSSLVVEHLLTVLGFNTQQ
jgi:hypothetical protein